MDESDSSQQGGERRKGRTGVYLHLHYPSTDVSKEGVQKVGRMMKRGMVSFVYEIGEVMNGT